ncbi:hypothetical protein C8R47DRAFT_1017587, partial [Mycena vitilis]
MATHSSNTSRAGSPSRSSGSESPSPAAGSVSASASSKGANAFYRDDTTFNPSTYPLPQRSLPLYRPPIAVPVPVPVTAVFDATGMAPPFDGVLVHPPFTNLPDGITLPQGMDYSVMHAHPTWFLDINDFITLDTNRDGAVRYPRDLEPPRPRRQKDLLLRCTFCLRTYAGVNAKSMWTRHVREKHRVVLSKAWSDTATSSRRQSTGKVGTTTIALPLLPIDTALPVRRVSTGMFDDADSSPIFFSTSEGNKSPLTTAPLAVAKPPPPPPKAKPGRKPASKPAKPTSPAKPKKVTASTGKIVIPAQKPKPKPVAAPPP